MTAAEKKSLKKTAVAAEPADSKNRNRILAVLFIGVLMSAIDIAIVGPALPALKEWLKADDKELGWIFSVFVLFNLISAPIMAKLSDRYGRKKLYVFCVFLFAAGSIAVAYAQNYSSLLAGRALQGFGAGGILPVAGAVIGDVFAPEKRGRALGMIGAVFGLAFIIGPLLGALLLPYGWKWLFLINLPVALVTAVLAWMYLPDVRASKLLPFDFGGVFISAAALVCFVFAIDRADAADLKASLLNPLFLTLAVSSFILFGLLYLVEKRAGDPLFRTSLFSRRQVRLIVLLAVGAGVLEASIAFVPMLAVNAYGISHSKASMMMMSIVIAMLFGSPLFGRLVDKISARFVVFLGILFSAAGLILYGQTGENQTLFHISGVLLGLGMAAVLGSSLRALMLSESAVHERAGAQASLSLFTSMGLMAAGVAAGAVAQALGSGLSGYSASFTAAGIFAAVLMVPAVMLKSKKY